MKKYLFILVIALAVIGGTHVFAENSPSIKATSGLGIGIGDRSESESDDGHGDDRPRMLGVNADAHVSVEAKGRDRAIAEIDRRVDSLNKLEARINSMKRVSDANKAILKASIDAQITLMQDLKTKIQNDTDDATLKADIQSITKAYRIYMVIIPQGAILAADDRIDATVDLMTTFGTKLDTRLTEATTAGHDVTLLRSTYNDYTAKIADAKVQADAAATLVANLHADNGDQATIDANKKAFADARAKIKVAMTDLQAARKDAQTIVQGLKAFNVSADAKVKADSR